MNKNLTELAKLTGNPDLDGPKVRDLSEILKGEMDETERDILINLSLDRMLAQLTDIIIIGETLAIAFERNVTKDEKYAKQLLEYYEHKLASDYAHKLPLAYNTAELYEQVGDIDSAIRICETFKIYKRAAELAEKSRKIEMALQFCEKGIEEGCVDAKYAAEFCRRHGMLRKAVQYFSKAKKWYEMNETLKEMGKQAREAGHFKEAMELFAEAGDYRSAYSTACKQGDIEKAVVYLALLGDGELDWPPDYLRAATFAIKEIGYERAIAVSDDIPKWRREGPWANTQMDYLSNLGRYANDHGEKELAIRIYEHGKMYGTCSKLAEEQGDLDKALEYAEKQAVHRSSEYHDMCRCANRVAELAEKCNQPKKAEAFRTMAEIFRGRWAVR
jgi:hypothetical protein